MKQSLLTNADLKKAVKKFGSPFLIQDLSKVQNQYLQLKQALPNFRLHYAVKPLPDANVIRALKAVGASFDLAGNGEIDLVKSQGVSPNDCIHTHPIKKDSDIRYALEFGCSVFVYDNLCELKKFIPYKKNVQLLLRLSFPNPETPVDLSKKFGCTPDEAMDLLKAACELGINVVGLSFHVGSQAPNPKRHVEAIETCNGIIRQAQADGIDLKILDIGGGFPVDYFNAEDTDIDAFCAPIREACNKLPVNLELKAEPGRFIAAPCMISVSSVVGVSRRQDVPWYYVDDGVYGSYSGQIFDHVVYPKSVISDSPLTEKSVLAGPTCDSIDILAEGINLPHLKVGDLLVGRMMGAYTSATATEFNFIPKAKIISVESLEKLHEELNSQDDSVTTLEIEQKARLA